MVVSPQLHAVCHCAQVWLTQQPCAYEVIVFFKHLAAANVRAKKAHVPQFFCLQCHDVGGNL